MENDFINIVNVCDIAKLMKNMDISFIKQTLSKDAQLFIDDFRHALDNFYHPRKDKLASYYSPVMLFDKHLEELIKTTKNLYSILSDEGKSLLQEQLAKKTV